MSMCVCGACFLILNLLKWIRARMAELVDALALGASIARCESSSLSPSTNPKQ